MNNENFDNFLRLAQSQFRYHMREAGLIDPPLLSLKDTLQDYFSVADIFDGVPVAAIDFTYYGARCRWSMVGNKEGPIEVIAYTPTWGEAHRRAGFGMHYFLSPVADARKDLLERQKCQWREREQYVNNYSVASSSAPYALAYLLGLPEYVLAGTPLSALLVIMDCYESVLGQVLKPKEVR